MAFEPVFGNTSTIGRRLAIGALQGHWTLEQLDAPSSSFDQLERDRARSATPSAPGRGLPTMRYPHAGTVGRPRNLAREWIAANANEWTELMQAHLAAEPARRPTPQVIRPEPRPATATAP
jgi:hypothetical protein